MFAGLICVAACVEDGWFKQPHLAESDWTLGLGEAANLLHTHTLGERSPTWQWSTLAMFITFKTSNKPV